MQRKHLRTHNERIDEAGTYYNSRLDRSWKRPAWVRAVWNPTKSMMERIDTIYPPRVDVQQQHPGEIRSF
jgi:hypothetical protein